MEGMFNKNLLIGIVVAFVVVILWDQLFLKDIREKELATQQAVSKKEEKVQGTAKPIGTIALATETKVVDKYPRVMIENSEIAGSLSLQAVRIDDITLKNHKETIDANSKQIRIFDIKGKNDEYFFESGWLTKMAKVDMPNAQTAWSTNDTELTEKQPVVFTWTNKQGLVFKKIISIDNLFMITIKDIVINKSKHSINVNPYALILRHGDPKVEDLFISHEGFVGNLGNTLERVDYDDTLSKSYDYKTQGGYLGFTDKYWLAAIVLDNKQNSQARFLSYKDNNNANNYQADSVGGEITIAPSKTISHETKVFVGPKEYNIVNNYDKQYSIGKFDDTIDFGWFFFFTKPMIKFLLWIHSLVGNFGVAILIFTVVIRAVILPIAYKSYISMAKMKELQPKMKELKELNKDNLSKYNKDVMELYKKEQVNPLSGCLPVLLQIPIFFSIYKVIFVSIEMRHSPFFGWVKDLSAADTTNIFNLFGLIPVDMPSFLHIGIFPILMGVTMYFQQKLSASAALDPMQQKIFNMMPFVLVIVLANFPVGLVIYWTWSNILSILQQLVLNKKVHKEYGLKKRKKA